MLWLIPVLAMAGGLGLFLANARVDQQAASAENLYKLSLPFIATDSASGSANASPTASPTATPSASPTTTPTSTPISTVTTTPQNASAQAKSMLLTLQDFPTGWTAGTATTGNRVFQNPMACPAVGAAPQEVGEASSGLFQSANRYVNMTEVVAIYATAGDASAALDFVKPQVECALPLGA